jgi:hypothetical protein
MESTTAAAPRGSPARRKGWRSASALKLVGERRSGDNLRGGKDKGETRHRTGAKRSGDGGAYPWTVTAALGQASQRRGLLYAGKTSSDSSTLFGQRVCDAWRLRGVDPFQ